MSENWYFLITKESKESIRKNILPNFTLEEQEELKQMCKEFYELVRVD